MPTRRLNTGRPVSVLRGVNLAIGAGEFVAVLGRVGAGKSTLCMALNGLVPHATGGIFRGDVTVLGRNTKTHAIVDLARSAGWFSRTPRCSSRRCASRTSSRSARRTSACRPVRSRSG